jgi:hypothetical protein
VIRAKATTGGLVKGPQAEGPDPTKGENRQYRKGEPARNAALLFLLFFLVL